MDGNGTSIMLREAEECNVKVQSYHAYFHFASQKLAFYGSQDSSSRQAPFVLLSSNIQHRPEKRHP